METSKLIQKEVPNDPIESNRNKVDNTINEIDSKTTKNLQSLEAKAP